MYIRKLQLIAGKSLLRLSAAEVFVFIDTYSRNLKAKFLNLFSSGKTENEIMEELSLSKSDYNKLTLILKVRVIRNIDSFDGEAWKSLDFIGFPYYKVSNFGRVSRLGRIKTLIKNKSGYLKVNLYHLDIVKTYAIHRLVLMAFAEDKSKFSLTVNHIDGIRDNNHISNLEWATHKEQSYHRDHIGPNAGINKIIFAGSKNPMSKLTEEIVLSIYNEPKELTNREISNKYDVPYERVRLIRNGEIWKSVTQTQGSTTSRKA